MKKSAVVLLLISALLVTVSQGFSRKSKHDKELSHMTEQQELTSEEKMDVSFELSMVELTLKKAPGNLAFKVEIMYDEDYFEPLISYKVRGDYGILELGMEYDEDMEFDDFDKLGDVIKGAMRHGDKDMDENRWEVLLTDRIPLEIAAEFAMGNGEMDLSGLKVQELRIEAGMSDMTVKFDEPNPIKMDRLAVEAGLGEVELTNLGNASAERLTIEVGLGSATVDLSGTLSSSLDAEMDVGLGSLKLLIPEGTPVKINCKCSFLSSVDLDRFKEIDDDEYVSPAFDDDKDFITLNLAVGLGSAEVEWVE